MLPWQLKIMVTQVTSCGCSREVVRIDAPRNYEYDVN